MSTLTSSYPHPSLSSLSSHQVFCFHFDYCKEFRAILTALYGGTFHIQDNTTHRYLLLSLPQLQSQKYPYHNKQSKQYAYWSCIRYMTSILEKWRSHLKMVDPACHSLICRMCGGIIGSGEDFCFYYISEKHITLALFQHLNHEYENTSRFTFAPSTKDIHKIYSEIHCVHCNNKIGSITAHGLEKSKLLLFSNEKVCFNGFESYQSKWKALSCLPEFQFIPRENFVSLSAGTQHKQMISTPKFVLPSREEDFGWADLLVSQLKPRPEQLRAFHLSLTQNSIIMLPTGAGKSLIATLTIARFVLLNPTLLAVMLVDRIPLVHQHTQSIIRDAGLKCFPLCSETSCPHIKSRIVEGHYQCLISTAGAFLQLFEYPGMHVEKLSVVVFDECHHATGDHVYCEILRRVHVSQHRPRLIGLSASPVSGKDANRIQSALRDMKEMFLQAVFYKPGTSRLSPEYTWHLVELSQEQKIQSGKIQDELVKFCLKLQEKTNDRKDERWFRQTPLTAIFSWANALYPRPAVDHYHITLSEIGRKYEVNRLLGPSYVSLDTHEILNSTNGHILSPFLVKLESIIRALPLTSRIIIFVDQKDSARRLQSRLKFSFPRLCPATIVGKTGWNGMNWEDQIEILNNFNRPNSDPPNPDQIRLIVSTSVLEEGLNVSECDAVFRFGVRGSFIQFVQSRGRARSGTMHVILTPDERLQVDTLLKEEMLLNRLADAESAESSLLLNDICQKYSLEYPDLDESETFLLDMPDACPIALKFFANCPSQKQIQSDIKKELMSLGFISNISFLHLEPGKAVIESGNQLLFDETDSVITINLSSDSSMVDFIQHLISMWQFSVRYANNKVFDVYLNVPANLYSEIPFQKPAPVSKIDDILHIDVVFLRNRRTYEAISRLGSKNLRYSTLSISDNNILKVEGKLYDDVLLIQSHISSLCSFALLSADQRVVTLFLFFNSTPALLLLKDNDVIRISTPHDDVVPPTPDDPTYLAQLELMKFAETPLFAISFPLKKWIDILSLLSTKIRVFVSHLIVNGSIGAEEEQRQAEISLIKDQFWSKISHRSINHGELEVLLSLYSVGSLLREMILTPLSYHQIKMDVFRILIDGDIESTSHQNFLSHLSSLLNGFSDSLYPKTLWTDCFSLYISLKEHYLQSSYYQQFPAFINQIDGYRTVYRIMITPSKVLLYPTFIIKSNRLLRKFSRQLFAYVSFVDENYNPIFNTNVFHNRFYQFLLHGVCFFSITFTFVLCSASQLRMQRAIFVCGDFSLAQSLRDSIAHIDNFKSDVTKYLSRLGLFCTADTQICTEINSVLIEPDIFTHNNDSNFGKNLVDGAGKISAALMSRVHDNISSQGKSFCAFQFRYGGSKGVLYLCNLPHCDILLRESNVKFPCSDTNLCLVQPATFNPVFINREMLNLLFSFRHFASSKNWNPFPYVRKLLRRELTYLGDIFHHQNIALTALTERLRNNCLKELCSTGFQLYEDHFVQQMLLVIYHYRCRMLRTKVHIPLESGAYLMGIPDPTGELNEGEVFYQLDDKYRPRMIGMGPHLVYRNPCLDPSDLRLVTAVDVPSLRIYYNVLIFPAATFHTRSISAECSGGDLDGDMFSIIYDENLIPPVQLPATDYDLIAKEAQSLTSNAPRSLLSSNENFKQHISESVINFMTNSNLGRIARLHLALCDILPDQAVSPLAREVARNQSLAVDYPKTGVSPRIPLEAKNLIKEKGYPSFMENTTKPSYVSNKPLGILYHDTISGIFTDQMTLSIGAVQPNSLFHLSGKEAYEKEIKTIFAEYCSNVRQILNQYSLKFDAELVLSLPLALPVELIQDQRVVEQSLSDIWTHLRKKYLNKFLELDGDMTLKASMWYHVAHTVSPYYLSFYYIILEYLIPIANINNSIETTYLQVSSVIGQTVLEYWFEIRDEVREIVRSKTAFFEQICTKIKSSSIKYKLYLYGSVKLFLCDEDSDLDIFVCVDENKILTKDQQNSLLQDFLPIVENHSYSMKLTDGIVPVLKGYFENPVGENQHVDFSACVEGLHKVNYLLSFYLQSPCNVVIMNCLMNWARWSQLIAASVDHENQHTVASNCLRKGQFHALVLSILYEQDSTSPQVDVSQSMDCLDFDEFSSDEIGGKLLTFFRTCQALDYTSDFQFTWPVDGAPVHTISSEIMVRITLACSRAYHALVISKDWKFLQENANSYQEEEVSTVRRIRLSTSFAQFLLKDSRWHIMQLENASHASIQINSTEEHCVIVGRGTRRQLMAARRFFRQYYLKTRRYLTGSLRTNNSAYFMLHSTLLLCKTAYSIHSKCTFEPYLGPKSHQHQFRQSSRVISSFPAKDTWKESYKKAVKAKFLQQLEPLFLQDQEKITVFIYFGIFYTINAHDCFKSSEVSLHDLTLAYVHGRREKRRNRVPTTRSLSHLLFCEDDDIAVPSKSNLETKKKSRHPSLSSSFWNSILDWKDSDSLSAIMALEQIFTNLGYTRRDLQQQTLWKVSYQISPSYEVSVKYLDDINSPISINERPLNWLNVTLLSGKSSREDLNVTPVRPGLLCDHDMRLRVSTYQPVNTDDPLYPLIFPVPMDSNPTLMEPKALFSLDQCGNPIPRDSKVGYLQKVISRTIYDYKLVLPQTTFCSAPRVELNIQAHVSQIDHYQGSNLEDKRSGISLSLKIGNKSLLDWLEKRIHDSQIEEWLDYALEHILVISEKISNYHE